MTHIRFEQVPINQNRVTIGAEVVWFVQIQKPEKSKHAMKLMTIAAVVLLLTRTNSIASQIISEVHSIAHQSLARRHSATVAYQPLTQIIAFS